jgi:hypothetical protein
MMLASANMALASSSARTSWAWRGRVPLRRPHHVRCHCGFQETGSRDVLESPRATSWNQSTCLWQSPSKATLWRRRGANEGADPDCKTPAGHFFDSESRYGEPVIETTASQKRRARDFRRHSLGQEIPSIFAPPELNSSPSMRPQLTAADPTPVPIGSGVVMMAGGMPGQEIPSIFAPVSALGDDWPSHGEDACRLCLDRKFRVFLPISG